MEKGESPKKTFKGSGFTLQYQAKSSIDLLKHYKLKLEEMKMATSEGSLVQEQRSHQEEINAKKQDSTKLVAP